MLKAGIVGLPNVGKSTLFNALTRTHKAAAENYPFCTIEPNFGVVPVPDARLDALAEVAQVPRKVPATIEFVDIAGLVKGASQGEGLGNKFLSHIREVDAVIHVVRCFEDADVHHVTGTLDAVRDIEIVTTELVLADLETAQRRAERVSKDAKRGDKQAQLEMHCLERLIPHLNSGQPANLLHFTGEEAAAVRSFGLVTAHPTLYVANVRESDLAQPDANTQVVWVRKYARVHQACDTVVVCARLESDLADLTPEEAAQYRAELGVSESGAAALIRATYRLLGLRTFFTFNESEVRAWSVPAGTTAARAAGRIHTDFERGFIKAERVRWDSLVRSGSVARAREHGHYSHEGREYEVQDGDVLLFKYHV